MRIFVAGATGVLGSRVVPLLLAQGHTVAGLTRSAGRGALVTAMGAEPVVCDVFDRPGLATAVAGAAPDLVLHLLTDLPDDRAELPGRLTGNARIRIEGTANLLAAVATSRSGPVRVLAESVAWAMPSGYGADAVAALEQSVLAADGVVLRYGQLYGPGTYYPDTPPERPRVSVDAAAEQTVAALSSPPGIVTIVDR